MSTAPDKLIFLTLMRTAEEADFVRLLIASIRAFGGDLRFCPVWVFTIGPRPDLATENVEIIPLDVPVSVKQYFFADKVFACAQAEALVAPEVQTLVWIDPECLVVQPPDLFDLGAAVDTAVRPVHIKNVGLSPDEPLDLFWQKVLEVVGLEDVPLTVETFIGQEPIRAYFNTHAFAINPAKGLLQRWFALFSQLVADQAYQTAACQDVRHRIFLHQAVWSALLVAELDKQRIRILPPTYNYPYNLHDSVPVARRAQSFNELTCFTYEERTLQPDAISDIKIAEPLATWLRTYFAKSG